MIVLLLGVGTHIYSNIYIHICVFVKEQGAMRVCDAGVCVCFPSVLWPFLVFRTV